MTISIGTLILYNYNFEWEFFHNCQMNSALQINSYWYRDLQIVMKVKKARKKQTNFSRKINLTVKTD